MPTKYWWGMTSIKANLSLYPFIYSPINETQIFRTKYDLISNNKSKVIDLLSCANHYQKKLQHQEFLNQDIRFFLKKNNHFLKIKYTLSIISNWTIPKIKQKVLHLKNQNTTNVYELDVSKWVAFSRRPTLLKMIWRDQ